MDGDVISATCRARGHEGLPATKCATEECEEYVCHLCKTKAIADFFVEYKSSVGPDKQHCYTCIEEFHREMTNAVLNRLDEKEIPVLMKTLDGLSEFFRGYSSEE